MTALTDKKIVITGATGLVGSHLVAELLGQGFPVHLLVREHSRFDVLDATLRRMGVADRSERITSSVVALNNPLELAEALQGAEVVFHCAARVSFDADDREEIVGANTEMAMQVSEACLACGVGLLVYVSSVAALDEPAGGTSGATGTDGASGAGVAGASGVAGVVTEQSDMTSLGGRSSYSVSKFYAENAVRRAAMRGLRTVIVNPAVILGETDWKSGSGLLVATLVRCGWGYPPGVKGYVDVRDVARAMVLLATTEEAVGKRFILSAGNLSFRELMTRIARAAGRPVPRFAVGRGVLKLAASIGALLSRAGLPGIRLSDALVANAVDKTYYDGTLLSRVTGFRYTPLDETIRRVVTEFVNDKKRKV